MGDICVVLYKLAYVLGVRFKEIKQDPRASRPEASGEGDISYLGDVPGSDFSVLAAYSDLMVHYPAGRPDRSKPFFLARDRARAYTYSAARARKA